MGKRVLSLPVLLPLLLPLPEVLGGLDYILLRLPLEPGGSRGAAGDAEAAADALVTVDDGQSVLQPDGPHLAPVDADPASDAGVRVHLAVVVGGGHGVLDAVLVDAPEYPAAAAAAVADVAEALHDVADGVDEAELLRPVEEGEGLLLGYVPGAGAALVPREAEAEVQGEVAPAAQLLLLSPADAVPDTEGLHGQDQRPHVLVGHYPLGLHRPLGGEHPVDGGLGPHDPLDAALGEVLLDEVGELVVHLVEARLVAPDDEGGEPVEPLLPPPDLPEEPLPRHGPEALGGLSRGHPDAGGDGLHSLRLPGEGAGYAGLLLHVDLLEHEDFDLRGSPREPVGQPVKRLG